MKISLQLYVADIFTGGSIASGIKLRNQTFAIFTYSEENMNKTNISEMRLKYLRQPLCPHSHYN